MEGIFQEFDNENSLRSYPFAGGCVPPENADDDMPAGVFIDAAIYPVNPSGAVYLSGISEDGKFSISDDSGAIMEGVASGRFVEFYDFSGLGRHVGTLVASSESALAEFAGRGVARTYLPENTSFAASCVIPVVIDGVVSISSGDGGKATGDVGFSNGASDDIRVSSGTLDDGSRTLRFDILPRPGSKSSRSIRRIICVVDGSTPFRIEKLAYNVILVRLNNVDKEDVCADSHREDGLEMYDACECKGKTSKPSKNNLNEEYKLLEVFIPPGESSQNGGADNAFYLVVPNTLGYDNPLSITLEDGVVVPKTEDPEVVIEGEEVRLADGEILDDVSSKCVVIHVPGLAGGAS